MQDMKVALVGICMLIAMVTGARAAGPDAAALRAACDRAGGAARADLSHQGRRYAVRCRARPASAARAPLRLEITPARLRIPPGYKPAYPPGRLNPHRGIGTPEGEARMNLIWTQTVPRRLVR